MPNDQVITKYGSFYFIKPAILLKLYFCLMKWQSLNLFPCILINFMFVHQIHHQRTVTPHSILHNTWKMHKTQLALKMYKATLDMQDAVNIYCTYECSNKSNYLHLISIHTQNTHQPVTTGYLKVHQIPMCDATLLGSSPNNNGKDSHH